MNPFVPSRLGCAAVSWYNGQTSLSIRVFYVSTNGELVMLSWDDTNYEEDRDISKFPALEWKVEQITYLGATINGIPQARGDTITAVSVHPNTPQHEIHLFYVAATSSKPRALQSLVLNVATGTWFADDNIGNLNTGDCPSAAIGWEVGDKNSFRLYFGREKGRKKDSGLAEISFNEIYEIAYDGDGTQEWYAGNGGQRISDVVTEALRQNGDNYTTRVSACTWLDAVGKRQVRVYHGNKAGNITELVYADYKWQKGGDYGDEYPGSRGYSSAAFAFVNEGNFEGIRQYAFRPDIGDSTGQELGPLMLNELAFDQKSANWSVKAVLPWFPGLRAEQYSDGVQEKIQFSAIGWRWGWVADGRHLSTSIRIYRVAQPDGATKPQIEESTFDSIFGQPGYWKGATKYI